VALNPALFMPIDEFKARVEHLVGEVHSAEKIADVERIYTPGEIEYLKKEDYLKNGIPFPPASLTQLEKFGQDLGVTVKLR